MPTSRTGSERLWRIVAVGVGLLVTLFGLNVARYSLHSYSLVFPLLAIGAGVLLLYFAIFRKDTLSSVHITILVVTMLITPYVGMLVFVAVLGNFTPEVAFWQVRDERFSPSVLVLFFWYWIPVCAMMLFPLTASSSLLALVIVHFYITRKTLPFPKSNWVVHVSILGSILGTLAVLPLLVSTAGFFIAGGADFPLRARLFLPTGLIAGCITGLIIALLTYRRTLLVIQERESAVPQ
jgi:hypothetical protein